MSEPIITIDDLHGNQREIAEVIGIDSYIKLSKYFGGEDSIYIQKYSELIKTSRNAEIRKLYKAGYSTLKISKIYGLSERYIRKLCQEDSERKF